MRVILCFSLFVVFCLGGFFGCDRDGEMERDGFFIPADFTLDPDYSAYSVWSTGTAVIYNPSEEVLSLVNLTRLISDDGRVNYRIMGECFVPANGKTVIVIGTDHAHFDLNDGECSFNSSSFPI